MNRQHSSFKDSFVDSDNFCDVDERVSRRYVKNQASTPSHLQGRQKSMKDLIKERFMGPLISSGNTQSLMKRNILVTSTNKCSYKSSACSIKSSFLVKRTNMKSSMNQQQQHNDQKRTLESYCFMEDFDENIVGPAYEQDAH